MTIQPTAPAASYPVSATLGMTAPAATKDNPKPPQDSVHLSDQAKASLDVDHDGDSR